MVETIRYDQLFLVFLPANAVEVTSFNQREVSGSAVGFNAGADVAFFFTRHVGVGGVVRVNRGTVSVDDPLSSTAVDLTLGQTTIGGGLRVHF